MIESYYKEDCFFLYHGSCLDILKSLPENSVDMIFADPPYNLSNGGFSVHSGRRVNVHKGDWDQSSGIDEDFAFHSSWIKACRRVLKPTGTIWISGTYHSIYQCGFALQMAGYRILNDIAWFKPNASPNIGCRCFSASHETLIWACKEQKAKYTFNYEDMKFGSWGKDFIKKPEKQMRSVWAIKTTPLSEKTVGKHPTQKPLELLNRILQASTKEGDVVLDPFTGSSSAEISAYSLSRSFIGIDNNRQFLNLSIKRFKEVKLMKRELSP
ncbi:MAG: site-specific DNA-methyltransferase [Oligoflexia bacterium]|nr:site-specific DNA-methyltransferase [Oligoflexia bacterium]